MRPSPSTHTHTPAGEALPPFPREGDSAHTFEEQPEDSDSERPGCRGPASRGVRRVSQTLFKGQVQSMSEAGLILRPPLPFSPKLLLFAAVVAGNKQEHGAAKERFPKSGQRAQPL